MTPAPTINLIPAPRIARKKLRARIRRWAVGMAAYVLVLLLGIAVRAANRTPILPPDPSAQSARITQLTSEVAATNKELTEARTRYAATLMLTGRPDWSVLLPLLGQSMGDDVVLKELKLAQSKGQVTRQYGLEMRGVARTAAAASNFVSTLEETRLFDEVRLLRTGREPFMNESMVSFDVQCKLSDAAKPAAGGGK
jgi:Tfp pilus assembly protein PilN